MRADRSGSAGTLGGRSWASSWASRSVTGRRGPALRGEVLGHLGAGLRHLVLLPGPAPPATCLDVLARPVRLDQGGLRGALEVLHLHGEEGELQYGGVPLLRVPSQDVLLLQLVGVRPDVLAAYDLAALLDVLHGEQCVVSPAHVAEAKVYGGAVRRGRHHHVSHDPGYIEPVPRLFPGLFLSGAQGIR